jgi:GntR family transcriptional regulator
MQLVNTASGVQRARQQLLALLSSLPQGTQLPSERTLAKEFGVSRMTLRMAMEVLVRQGQLIKHSRSGTYLQRPIIASQLKFRSFTEEMKSRRVVPSSKILTFREVRANRELSLRLNVRLETKLFLVKRIRLGDGVPICIEKLAISQRVIPNLTRKALYGSLYDYFRSEYNIYIRHASTVISAYMPSTLEQQSLKIDSVTPCLYMHITDANQHGVPFMAADCIYRSDRYEISLYVQSDTKTGNSVEPTIS